jgi:hypothetical protein
MAIILILNSNSAHAFDPSLNKEDFNMKIEEIKNSIMSSVRLEMMRTGGNGVTWTYPTKPEFKVGELENNQKAIDAYVLAVQLTIKEILVKLNSLPTVTDSLTEQLFIEKLKDHTKNYFESSRILISKKATLEKIQNYFGYKKKFMYPEYPKYTGVYKTDIESISQYLENLRNVQTDLDRSFDRELVVTTSILDNKENFSDDSFEGFLIKVLDLSGKYRMKFLEVMDKNGFTCKENHSCSYNYFNQPPRAGLYSFDPGSSVERKQEFMIIEKLFAIWLENEIDNISLTRYSQIPYSDEFRSAQCKSQANATKKNLDSYQSTIDAIRNLVLQQNSNPDTMERDVEFREYIAALSQMNIGLNIWQEKLPIYFKRDAKCTQYQSLLEQTKDLLAGQKILLSTLKMAKSSKNTSGNQTFDQKQYDAQSNIVDKAVRIIVSSIPKKTIICINRKGSKKETGISPKCPAGFKQK